MSRSHNWDVYADEAPTEIHHEDCGETPESFPTGDATAAAVADIEQYADGEEEFDRSCDCLDSVMGVDLERIEEGSA